MYLLSEATNAASNAASTYFWLFKAGSVGLTTLVICTAAAAGLALGSLKFKGIGLGIGGVLFAGLTVGKVLGPHALHHEVLEFAREFGLILFVYTIGVAVGPGFFASLRKQGLKLNLLAATIVLLGVATTIGVSKVGHIPMKDAVGLLSGATTNTPSLAAANDALKEKGIPDKDVNTGATYATAYPFGILGIIFTMIGVRTFFRVNLKHEGDALAAATKPPEKLRTLNIEVKNTALHGRPIANIPGLKETHVVISRVMHNDAVRVAGPETVIRQGDVLLAVGTQPALDTLCEVVGDEADVDLTAVKSPIITRKLLVTHRGVLGQRVAELDLPQRYGVTVTRVRRNEVEVAPGPNVALQFGDQLTAVGEEESIKAAAKEVGDSVKQLNHPMIIPVFVGIALGVILGSIPLKFPGMPAAIKLGLAGGPLLAALILSRLGHFGPLVWYLPAPSNFIMREIGIVLFLACVGIISGDKFFNALQNGTGWYWMGCGALITAIPLAIVALVGRVWMKLNYMTLCGLLAGSMTDPPALAFAGQATQSDAPSIAYAAVYPLTMVLRVLFGQILVLAMV